MKKKDTKLFNKAIHEVKKVINEIYEEREEYHIEVTKMRKHHDKAVKRQMKELLKVVNELYELYDDLSNNGDK